MKFLELFVIKSFFHIISINTTEINENPRDLQENNQNVMNNSYYFIPIDYQPIEYQNIDYQPIYYPDYNLDNLDQENLIVDNKKLNYLNEDEESLIYQDRNLGNIHVLSNGDEYVDEKKILEYNKYRKTYIIDSKIYEKLPIFNEKKFENPKVNEIIKDSIYLILHVHFEDAKFTTKYCNFDFNKDSLKPKIWKEYKENDFFKKTCGILNIKFKNYEKALEKILEIIYDNFIKENKEKYKKWIGEQ